MGIRRMKKFSMLIVVVLTAFFLAACQGESFERKSSEKEKSAVNTDHKNANAITSKELEYIPDAYREPSDHPGKLEKLTYQTWESFSYEEKSQELAKEAWVYTPYGYSEEEKYNVFYISHGGWSNETTIMGTDKNPRSFKHVIDHAIEDGKIQPLILVFPTYNNTSGNDSGDYSLALQLTDQFHNELLNDLLPAVEGKYSTYAGDTTPEGLIASRDHRGFGGFSMGSVNTWCTFRYGLDYFRYFMPMSGSYTTDGEYMAEMVRESGYDWEDFFIFSASGTDDFAYSAFKQQIIAMGTVSDDTFRFADNEKEGNLLFLEREGYKHDVAASDEYTYNGLRFFWNDDNVTVGTEEYEGFLLDNILHSETEGDIHYNVYIPDSYDGTEPSALYFTLLGYQGLYFQGVGTNVRTEEFGFTAREYIPDMIIVAPQLNDWKETSARQTIALAEYFLKNYNIDSDRIYGSGYSGGGETMSLVMGMRSDFSAAYLHCRS